MQTLSRKQEKLLRQLGTRQGRRKFPYFLCEGERCCAEAFRHCPDQVEFVLLAEDYAGDLNLDQACTCSATDFSEFAQTEGPQGILAVLRRPKADLDRLGGSLLLVLDRLADPGNLGTLLRTAWAFDLPGAILTKGSCDPFSSKAVRAGMGAQFVLELPTVDSLDQIAQHWPERSIWIADVECGVPCCDDRFQPENAILVLGNEAGGAGSLAGASRVHIPMPGNAESLNVAQAGTLLLYEAFRRGAYSAS